MFLLLLLMLCSTTVGCCVMPTGDSLSYHTGQQFTTFDQDNDLAPGDCAVVSQGAWWYNDCGYSNLNGKYYKTQTRSYDAAYWFHFKNIYESIRRSEMKITPFN